MSEAKWQAVKPKENRPIYLEKMFGPIFYHLKRAVEYEIKDFEQKTGKKVNRGGKNKNKHSV